MTREMLAITAAMLFVVPTPARAAMGPLNPKTHRCVDSTVLSRGYRLEGAPDSGSAVEFVTTLGLGHEHAAVVSYETIPVVAREHRGDRVQVCLMSTPRKDQFCDPAKDLRGRVYRVYDYRQRAAYSGMNSEHDCGGA